MIGLPLERVISAEAIVPSGRIRSRTVHTNVLSWAKIDVGCSHWLKKRL
jgi:hypothetical protein